MTSLPILQPGVRVTDADGNPVSGAKLKFFGAGTTTALTVFADAAAVTPLGAIVHTDDGGYPVTTPTGSVKTLVYTLAASLKLVITDANDVILATHDDVTGSIPTPVAATIATPSTPVVTRTGDYQIVLLDRGKLINANPTSGHLAMTLPSAITVGDGFRVGVRHAGPATTNVVTVRTIATQPIGGSGQASAVAVTLVGLGETVWMASDGAGWSVDTHVPPMMAGGLPRFLVTDRLTAPPSGPAPGARYIINGAPTGLWATLSFTEHDVAEYDGAGGYLRYIPREGWSAYVADENFETQFRDGTWVDLANAAAPAATENTRIHVISTSADGVGGGVAVVNVWTPLKLNSLLAASAGLTHNATTGVTTLPAGDWRVRLRQTFYGTGNTQIRFRSTVTGTVFYSDAKNSQDIGANMSIETSIEREFVSIAGETFVAEYFCTATSGAQDLGVLSPNAVGPEVHGALIIEARKLLSGPRGADGPQGANGLDAAYPYQWATTTAGNPGAGKVAGNTATLSTITEIAISETAIDGAPLSAVLAAWGASTSAAKGFVRIAAEDNTANFVTLRITAAGTDQGAYWTFPVAHVASNGTLTAGATTSVLFVEKGDKGDAGITVPSIAGLTLLAAGVDGTADRLIVRDTSADADKQVAPLTIVRELVETDYVMRSLYASGQLAALAALGRVLMLAPGDQVSLAIPTHFATADAAVQAIARWMIPVSAKVTISVIGHQTVAGDIARIAHPCSDRIEWLGTSVDTTFSQINSVTGVPGAYAVTATVPTPSLIDVGDVLMVRNVKPGVKPPGELTGYPHRGEIRLGFFALGGSVARAYIKTVGVTATVWQDAACATTPATGVNVGIASGDIVMIMGQVRRVSVITPGGFTLSTPLQKDVFGLQYWYHMTRSGQGTVSINGGVVTGHVTLFASQYQPGDYIFIADSGCARIETIAAEDGVGCITLDRDLPDCATESFGCAVLGELHEGAWLVTGKSGSQITWTNTNRVDFAKPPVKSGITTQITGDLFVLKSSLRTSGNSSKGFITQGGATACFNHLALVGAGAGSSGSVGLDLRGYDQTTPAHPAGLAFLGGHVRGGARSAVLNWGYGAWLQSQSFAGLDYAMVSGCTVRGINNNFGGKLSIKGAVISGNLGLGVLNGPGAFCEWSDARINGNSDDGFRGIGGGSTWYAEFPSLACNGSDAIAVDDSVSCHHNGARLFGHRDGGGTSSDNGGYGRMTGCLHLGNAIGMSWTNAQVEASQNAIYACNTGVIINNSRLDIDDLGVGNCTSHALRALGGARRILGRDVQISGSDFAIFCQEGADIYVPGVALGGGSVTATGGLSSIFIEGYINGGAFSPATLNQADVSGNIISAGADVANVPRFGAIELGDGADTTITRSSAGNIAVEGQSLYRANGTNVAVADGGTAADTAIAAAANLGVWHVLAKSAVAVSHTGTLTKTTLATVTIPAGAMGPNGVLRITTLWSYTNSVNSKTLWLDLGGNAFGQIAATTSATLQAEHIISNRNNPAQQMGFARTAATVFGASTGAVQTAAANTALAVDLTFAATLAMTSETITLERYIVEICYGA